MHLARTAIVVWSLVFIPSDAAVSPPTLEALAPRRPAGQAPTPVRQPARDRIPERAGKAAIRGQVLAADTRNPIARAAVIVSAEMRGAQGTRVRTRDDRFAPVLTDADGRFEFNGLAGARYRLSASRRSYVQSEYGQRGAADGGKAIDLADGQTIEGIEILLTRSSAISGTALDDLGEPVEGARMTAFRRVFSQGQRRLTQAGSGYTDDLGSYRLFGLAPGTYYVAAMPPDAQKGADESVSFAPTYYPGTPKAAEASPVTLKPGEERLAVDLTLMAARPARVSGLVVDSSGQPAVGARVDSVLLPGEHPTWVILGGAAAITLANGTFVLGNMRPGLYSLMVEATNQATGEKERGQTDVTVLGGDVTAVAVATVATVRASGRVRVDARATTPPPRGRLRVVVGSVIEPFNVRATGVEVSDATFQLTGIPPGRARRFFVEGLPSGWTLESVRYQDRDIADTGIDIVPNQSLTGIEIVLSDQVTELTGTVSDADGQTVTDYQAIVFSDDSSKWTWGSRSLAIARPNQNARFTISDLRPGTYLAVAVDGLAEGDAYDPDVLAALKSSATRFTLREGEKKTLALRLVKPTSTAQEATCGALR